jgi:hypothetical protein
MSACNRIAPRFLRVNDPERREASLRTTSLRVGRSAEKLAPGRALNDVALGLANEYRRAGQFRRECEMWRLVAARSSSDGPCRSIDVTRSPTARRASLTTPPGVGSELRGPRCFERDRPPRPARTLAVGDDRSECCNREPRPGTPFAPVRRESAEARSKSDLIGDAAERTLAPTSAASTSAPPVRQQHGADSQRRSPARTLRQIRGIGQRGVADQSSSDVFKLSASASVLRVAPARLPSSGVVAFAGPRVDEPRGQDDGDDGHDGNNQGKEPTTSFRGQTAVSSWRTLNTARSRGGANRHRSRKKPTNPKAA